MRQRPAEPRAAALSGAGRPGWLLPVCLGCLCLLGQAQGAEAPALLRLGTLEPRVAVSEVVTDNHDGSVRGEGDAITRLTAGLGWRARSGMVRGYLDYALTSLVYARHSDRNDLQNALSANLTADLIDNRLQFATSAAVARRAISAFGVQPGAGADGNTNTTETRTLQIAPTLRGPLGPDLRYTAALAHAVNSTSNSGVGESATTTANLHLEPASPSRLTWTLDASHLTSDYKLGRTNQSDRIFGGLKLGVDDLDLQFTATGGLERTNFISLVRSSHSTWGVGAVWAPSPVTRVSAEMENRFFGRSHAISVEHRTPRTVFRYRHSRSLSVNDNQTAGERGEAFDLVSSLLSSAFPDTAQREALVDRFLQDKGFDRTTVIDTGFLRSAATVQDLQEFSAAWTAPRNAALLLFSMGKTRRVDSLSTAFDDLSNVDEVQVKTLSLNLSHRLTPLSTLNLLLSMQRSGSGTAALFGRQTLAELQFSTRLTPDATAGASLRRVHYNTGLQPYDETAFTATYGLRF